MFFKRFFSALMELLRHSKSTLFGTLTSAFEWYDYALFGYFASTIGLNFFPESDRITILLQSFAVFASGFAMRPLGAIIFGYIGDRIGRKKALIASLFMMAIPTTLLGLLPTYNSIGLFAPIALVFIRLLQGLAMGGNYGGSYIFTIERAPVGKKGLAGSVASFGVLGGLFLGSGIAFLSTTFFYGNALSWRIPFLLGGLSALTGFFAKNLVSDDEKVDQKVIEIPVKAIFKNHLSSLLKAIGIILLDGVGIYILFVFMPTFAFVFLGLPANQALLINTITLASLVFTIPLFGFLGDEITQKRILKYISLGFIALPLLLFVPLICYPSIFLLLILQIVFSIFMGAAYGTLPAAVVTMFPKSVRYTACGLAFNISVAVFGGTAPFVVTFLMGVTGLLIIPAVMLMVVGVVSYISSSKMLNNYD